ncbi:glutamate 5-kinase, partial [Dehalococcoidia bacterium]|nr:glutamate 5-kinase [Dehalococcoidia bacterium]
TALQRRNKSLLPAGVVRVDGVFERGDVVAIVDSEDSSFATGISNYSSTDIAQIKGCRSDRIEGILCYEYGDEVVHRDNLVVS